MGTRVVRWPLDLLCSLQERFSRLQHTFGRGSSLLHDPLLVDEDVSLFLDVFPPLTGPCQRCQPCADRVTYGCCWALDESAGAAQVPPGGCSPCCRSGQEEASDHLRPLHPGIYVGHVEGESRSADALSPLLHVTSALYCGADTAPHHLASSLVPIT